MMVNVEIRSSGEFCQHVDEPLPELKAHVVDAIGQSVRRVSRFMQLALIGAGRCTKGQALPPQTAVFLASARGDLELTTETIDQVFRNGLTPKPLNFVNTVSNAAAFYVAQCLRLNGRSSFVCNRHFAFESALQLALCSLQLGEIESALVGVVDGVVAPLRAHRQRLQLSDDAPLAEASHWLWLTRTQESTQSTHRAQLIVHQASDYDDLIAWLDARSLKGAELYLCAGQYLDAQDNARLQEHLQRRLNVQRLEQSQQPGYYATRSAATIIGFMVGLMARRESATLLHVNREPLGRYCVVLWEK